MTLVLGLSIRRVFPKILKIPARFMLPIIGVLGYVLNRFGYPMAPIVIGLVLGPIIEINLRNGLVANDMDFSVFITPPISGFLLAAIVATLAWSAWKPRGR